MNRLALLGRPVPELAAALTRLLRARALGEDAAPAVAGLARVLRDAGRFANLAGRAGLLARLHVPVTGATLPAARPKGLDRNGNAVLAFKAVGGVKPIPAVSFDDAIRALLAREPALAEDAAEVAELYSTANAFAVARSADLELTAAVQERLAKALKDGLTERDAAQALLTAASKYDATGWTLAFARNVYRTNAATAYSDGWMAQARDPDVRAFLVGFVFRTAGDADVRPNHRAGEGFVAAPEDSRWRFLAPPIAWQCRCDLVPLDRPEARRRGLLDARTGELVPQPTPRGFAPDAGFRPGAGRLGGPEMRGMAGGPRRLGTFAAGPAWRFAGPERCPDGTFKPESGECGEHGPAKEEPAGGGKPAGVQPAAGTFPARDRNFPHAAAKHQTVQAAGFAAAAKNLARKIPELQGPTAYRDTMIDYGGNGAEGMNKSLRNVRDKAERLARRGDAELAKGLLISRAAEANVFEKPIAVYRGVGFDRTEQKQAFIAGLQPGASLRLWGLQSTSTEPGQAIPFARSPELGMVFEIATDRGAVLGNNTVATSEKEIILGHGWSYDVVSVEGSVVRLRLASTGGS